MQWFNNYNFCNSPLPKNLAQIASVLYPLEGMTISETEKFKHNMEEMTWDLFPSLALSG